MHKIALSDQSLEFSAMAIRRAPKDSDQTVQMHIGPHASFNLLLDTAHFILPSGNKPVALGGQLDCLSHSLKQYLRVNNNFLFHGR